MLLPKARRRAYTLLEVLLAAAIGVVLLAALYVAFDVQLRQTRSGRALVESSEVARNLLVRFDEDVALSMAPTPSQTTSAPGSSSSTTPTATTAPTNGGTGAASGAAATTPTTTSTPTGSTSSAVTFNLGVQGDNNQLTIYQSRWPREVGQALSDPDNAPNMPVFSDLRRVTWWLADGPGGSGLARQEVKLATSDDALNAPAPDLSDGYSKLVAREVKSLTFQYFDVNQQAWVDSWDGTQAGPDGTTPIGPPAAISITVEIALPNADGEPVQKTFRHIVALPTANGAQSQTTTTSTGGTTP
jgi:prepilin-type N-terminal cleavage/methylation domain-containing protein